MPDRKPYWPVAALFCGAVLLASCATGTHIEPSRDVACFGRAAVSLAEAVTFAQNARPAQIVDAEYNCQEEFGCLTGNPGGYDVVYYDNGRLDRVNVCPVTGTVRPPLERSLFRRMAGADFIFDWPESEMRRGAEAVASAPVSLLRAIAVAEEQTGHPAMAVHLQNEEGETYYAVEIVENGRVHLVLVGLEDGSLRQP